MKSYSIYINEGEHFFINSVTGHNECDHYFIIYYIIYSSIEIKEGELNDA